MMAENKRGKKAAAANWHPDFRDGARLPDIKVVRTSFFIGTFSFFVAAALLLIVAYREYETHALKSQISVWQDKVQSLRDSDQAMVGLNREFVTEIAKIEKVEEFLQDSLPGFDFLTLLSRYHREEMLVREIRFQRRRISLRGTIDADSQMASDIINSYLNELKEEDFIQEYFKDARLDFLVRDTRTMHLAFMIHLELAEPEEEKESAE